MKKLTYQILTTFLGILTISCSSLVYSPSINMPDKIQKDETKILFNRICTEIESRAFYDGYHLALAFGHGTCKSLWCPDVACAGLEPGKGCRFPLKSRSSMEAVGMDVFTMVARRGWEIYPVAERVDVAEIPHVLLVGLVLIV